MSSHVIIDRRKNDSKKSSVNRQKFIKRVKGFLRESVKDIVRDTDLKDLAGKGSKKVKIPIRNLDEPFFHHDNTGINDKVLPGNDKFVPGDKIARPEQDQSEGGAASADGEHQDTFTFHLTKEEFLDLFFENCALPDLVKQNLALLNEEILQRSGFTTDGSPAMMNIMRSMRRAKSRRSSFRALKNKKLKELLEREQELITEITMRKAKNQDVSIEQDALERVQHDIEILKRRIKSIPFIDPYDLQYNNWNKVQIPTVQAVMVCVMDVSGSMDERKKQLAKTFYLLLYLFLLQNYEHIAIEYITYHTHAQHVDEQKFYYGHDSGGTVTSSGLSLAYELILEKYPTTLWNIYLAHASDGDNFETDNVVVKDILATKLLPLLQYYAYVQINPDYEHEWNQAMQNDSNSLWNVFKTLSDSHKNVSAVIIENEEQVYPVFLKLFERKQ